MTNTKIKKGGIFEKGSITLTHLINSMKSQDNFIESGAIFTFTGICRIKSKFSTKPVKKIIIEAWEEKTDKKLHEIADKVQKELDLVDVRLFHGVGEFTLGEEMVYITVSSSHREEGLKAIEKLIKLYKTQAPLWKKEIYSDDTSNWIKEKVK
jgi:molybdopterin synthase catalytic subunit